MSHEHEAVYLAVASLDFELSPDERRRMEAGLAECPECAEIAASHGDVARLLDRLPVHDASPHVRQRIMRAALVPQRQNRWPVLLAAAALLGLTIATAAAAGAFRERSPLDGSVVAPSASLPALGDLESPLPSSSAGPVSSRGRVGTRVRCAARRKTRSPKSCRAGYGSGRRLASPTIRSSTSLCSMSATASWSSMGQSWRATTSGTRSWHGGLGTSMRPGRSAGCHVAITTAAPGSGRAPIHVRPERSRWRSLRPCIHRSGSPASVTARSACVPTCRERRRACRASRTRTRPASTVLPG